MSSGRVCTQNNNNNNNNNNKQQQQHVKSIWSLTSDLGIAGQLAVKVEEEVVPCLKHGLEGGAHVLQVAADAAKRDGHVVELM